MLSEQVPSPGPKGPECPPRSRPCEGGGGAAGLQLRVVFRTHVSEPGLALITWVFSSDRNAPLCKAPQATQRHLTCASQVHFLLPQMCGVEGVYWAGSQNCRATELWHPLFILATTPLTAEAMGLEGFRSLPRPQSWVRGLNSQPGALPLAESHSSEVVLVLTPVPLNVGMPGSVPCDLLVGF